MTFFPKHETKPNRKPLPQGLKMEILEFIAFGLFFLTGLAVLVLWLAAFLGISLRQLHALFDFVDQVFRTTQIGSGKIVYKEFVLAHTVESNRPTKHGVVSTPNQWFIAVSILGQEKKVEVSEEIYEAVRAGEIVAINYRLGRFTNRPHVRKISLSISPAA